jgi:hypothetical protein
MKLVSVILITILIKHIQSENTFEDEPISSFALKFVDKIKTYSVSSLSDRHSKVGFDNLKINNDMSSGDILIENIDKLIKLWFKNKIISETTTYYTEILIESLEEFALSSKKTTKSKINFDLLFSNKNDGGSMFFMNLEFSLHPSEKNILLWKKYISLTLFDVSADTMVLTNSKCDILKCKSSDSIVYLPKYITYEHVEAIMKINFMTLSVFFDNDKLIDS